MARKNKPSSKTDKQRQPRPVIGGKQSMSFKKPVIKGDFCFQFTGGQAHPFATIENGRQLIMTFSQNEDSYLIFTDVISKNELKIFFKPR